MVLNRLYGKEKVKCGNCLMLRMSLCPVCLQLINAKLHEQDGQGLTDTANVIVNDTFLGGLRCE